jgi:hypothetical protein
MTDRTSEIFKKIESLPAAEQGALAECLADHLEQVLDDARWTKLLEKSSETLDSLSAEVDQAIAAGDVAPLNPDKL